MRFTLLILIYIPLILDPDETKMYMNFIINLHFQFHDWINLSGSK